jgi:hypothetical protein
MGHVGSKGADTAARGDTDSGVGASPELRLLLRLMCTYEPPPSAGASCNGGLAGAASGYGLPPWDDTLLQMLLRMVLLLLLLLWRALCLAMRSSDSSRQAMAGGTSCIINTVKSTTKEKTAQNGTKCTSSLRPSHPTNHCTP